MTTKNGDMPAMPYTPVTKRDIETGVISGWENYGGLTKREQFAMAAMQGLAACGGYAAGEAAQNSVRWADALLAELEK